MITATALLSSTGCGLLGNKNLPVPANPGATGCLNNSKDLVTRYTRGEVSSTEWKAAFSCVNQSLDFFTTYVRGSTNGIYTPDDMYNLVKSFLITNHSVQPELLLGAFSLKSALFGGDDTAFTQDEINLLKSTLDRLQAITADLIPALKVRQEANPTRAELMDMVAAFKRSGDQLADLVSGLPTGMLSSEALGMLITQLTDSLDLPVIADLNTKVFLAKWILFNSRRDAIETSDWPRIFKTTMTVGGIYLAAKTALGDDPDAVQHLGDRFMNDPEFRDLMWSLGLELKTLVNATLASHGGSVPLPLLDHAIDEIPDAALKGLTRSSVKAALRPFVRRLLQSETKTGVDQKVIDTVFNLLGETIADLRSLDAFYAKTGVDRESATPQQLSQALSSYAASLSDASEKARFAIIKTKLLAYRPLFRKRTESGAEVYAIRFAPDVGYSRFQNVLELVIDRIGRHLLTTYAANPAYFTADDLGAFFNDYSSILFGLKIVNTTTPNFAGKRLQDMDLFTNVSNGNLQGSIEEVVNYAMILISSGVMTKKMRAEITPACDSGLGEDVMGWTLLPANCFRTQYNQRLEYWIKDDFPRLYQYWSTLNADERQKAMTWLEHGARRNGYTDEALGSFDIGAMSVILYYTESLFNRFDVDRSEMLARNEVDSAYPVFRELLRKTAKAKGLDTSSDFLLQGIYTYIVHYQEMPLSPANLDNAKKLAIWMATYLLPSTDYHTDRYGVFNIVCQIANPENPNQAPPNATVCKP
ncbi:MAG: hypothetical protein EBX52_05530 [Proteobacteria bacterium]|nr:hypothetical protein [Pseudomonadota bacterium]